MPTVCPGPFPGAAQDEAPGETAAQLVVAVIVHLQSYEVSADAVDIEGGCPQLSLGFKNLQGRFVHCSQQVHQG